MHCAHLDVAVACDLSPIRAVLKMRDSLHQHASSVLTIQAANGLLWLETCLAVEAIRNDLSLGGQFSLRPVPDQVLRCVAAKLTAPNIDAIQRIADRYMLRVEGADRARSLLLIETLPSPPTAPLPPGPAAATCHPSTQADAQPATTQHRASASATYLETDEFGRGRRAFSPARSPEVPLPQPSITADASPVAGPPPLPAETLNALPVHGDIAEQSWRWGTRNLLDYGLRT